MKKKDLYALACILCFAGCSSPASDEIEIVQNLFPVQFSIQLQKEILPFSSTRSIPPNTIPEPEIPDEGNQEKEIGDLCTSIEYVVFSQDEPEKLLQHRTYIIDTKDDFGIVYDTLPAGNYQACFLAHSATEVTFSENVFSFDNVSDSFYHAETLTIGKGDDINLFITLERIIGRIEFRASDPVPDEIGKFELSVSNYPGRFNIQTGKGAISPTAYHLTHPFTQNEKQQNGTSHAFLSFIPEGDTKISAVLTATDIKDQIMRTRTVANILPVQNKTIRYTGVLYTPPKTNESDNTFQLIIEDNGKWGETEEKELSE